MSRDVSGLSRPMTHDESMGAAVILAMIRPSAMAKIPAADLHRYVAAAHAYFQYEEISIPALIRRYAEQVRAIR